MIKASDSISILFPGIIWRVLIGGKGVGGGKRDDTHYIFYLALNDRQYETKAEVIMVSLDVLSCRVQERIEH